MVTVVPSATPSDTGGSSRAIVSVLWPAAVLLAAVVVPIALALALLPFRGQAPAATVALGFAVLVSLLAATGTRLSALIAALSAALCYDIGFTQPYGSLEISHPQDIETTALLLVGGLIVGQLSARNRSHRTLAVQQRKDLAHVQAIAELMAAGAEPARGCQSRRRGAAKPARPARVLVRHVAPGATRADHRPQRQRELGAHLVGG